MRRLWFYILFAVVAVALLAVAVWVVRPQLYERLGRMAAGQPAQSSLHVDVPRKQFPVKGIDISHHNGEIDFARVVADSVDFVYIKATEGVNHTDKRLRHNYEGAVSQGLMVGFYHFFRFDRGGVRQARHFLAAIDSMSTIMPLVIDFETASNATDVSYYRIVGRLRDMSEYLLRRGHRVMIYCNLGEYNRYIRGNFDHLDLWLASGRLPDDEDRRHLWQHSHNGRVAGIPTPVDINTFNGSRNDFLRWITEPSPRPVVSEAKPDSLRSTIVDTPALPDTLPTASAQATPPATH